MTHTAIVIDLGDDWAAPTDEHGGRGHRLGRMPRWATFLLLPALLVLLGGSAVPRPVLEPLWSLGVGVSYVGLSGDRAFVLNGSSTTVATSAITTYRAADGERLWRTPLPGGADWLEPVPGAGIVLAFGQSGSVTALSTATGQVRWRMVKLSIVDLLSDGQRLLTLKHEAGSADDLQLLDINTGQPVWSQPVTAGTQVAMAQDGGGRQSIGWVVAQAPDGTTRIIDEASGRTLRTAKLPAPGEDQGGAGALFATGQLLLTLVIRTSDTIVTAYDPITLERRWATELAGFWSAPSSCGPVICIESTVGLAAVDPATGSIRWTADGWSAGGLVGDRVAVAGQSDLDRWALIEPMSGRLHTIPGRWSPLSFPIRILLASDQAGGSGLWLGVLDDEASAVRPVGFLADVVKGGQCQVSVPTPTYLACSTIHGEVRLWRYDPPGG